MERFGFIAIKLGVICILSFILQLIYPDIISLLSLNSARVFEEPWRIATHIFIHANVRHLLSNMFALFLFGSMAERFAGSTKFMRIILASLFLSSLGSVIFYRETIGISGIVYGIIGYLAVSRPKTIVLAFGVPMYVCIAALLWIAIDITGIFYPTPIAHFSHIFGMISGAIFGLGDREWGGKNKRRSDVITDKEIERWEEKYMLGNIFHELLNNNSSVTSFRSIKFKDCF
ncbi:MAG TPA: rhomboid family intramembrane serine protease [Candidatus Aenigmarchaeota archaeon]|nr:rhomboid family intramembrane serine protease [Candidatus Aenigmarchaeota archaeon]